jgi:hypothetical protein
MFRKIFINISAIALVTSCGKESASPAPSTPEASVDPLQSTDDAQYSALSTAPSSSPLPLPLAPVNRPDLIGFEGSEWKYPQMPPLRFSADGRIAVEMKSGGDQLKFRMLVPERLNKHFYDENGVGILQRNAAGEVFSFIHPLATTIIDAHKNLALPTPIRDALKNNDWHVGHVSLCDTVKIPRACGQDDCYDLTAVASLGNKVQDANAILASFPITVVVTNPKTELAQISSVQTRGTSPVQLSPVFVGRTFFEPLAVGDGRLLIGRFAGSQIDWKNDNGKSQTGTYDVVYSVYEGGSPCDASKWTSLYPITHAPHHQMVKSKYDFARQPFRDSTGEDIPDGVELGVTYPWMDHEAKNLVFTTISDTLFHAKSDTLIESRFSVACISECENAVPSTRDELSTIENKGPTRGFAILGAWTRGKIRLLDGLINRADFGLLSHPGAFRSIDIYREADGSIVSVKVGANRDNKAIPNLDGYPGNTTFFDSITDRFFFDKHFQPRIARDVVWTGSNGVMTDEISFDESLDNRLLVFSDMTATLQYETNQSQLRYFNGNAQNGNPNSELRLQNIPGSGPKYGVVAGARIEPVALGGRSGRGVYLNTDQSQIKYSFDTTIRDPNLYVGFFVSPRGVGRDRQIVRFPNGSSINVNSGNIVVRSKQGTSQFTDTTVELPPRLFVNRQWVHLGIAARKTAPTANAPYQLNIYIDGMIIARQTFAKRPFMIDQGDLIIGGGFRGWFDEVRVMRSIPTIEEACNFAYGTMGLLETPASTTTSPSNWMSLAARYPDTSHAEVRAALIASGMRSAATDRFVCLVDHNSRFGWSTALPKPATIKSYLRSTLLMKGGEFKASQPRPDSRQNEFCLSCHEPAHLVPGLRIEGPLVLVPNRAMKNDRRKQPTQPIRIWGGHLPAGLLGDHSARALPANGETVYPYLFPD